MTSAGIAPASNIRRIALRDSRRNHGRSKMKITIAGRSARLNSIIAIAFVLPASGTIAAQAPSPALTLSEVYQRAGGSPRVAAAVATAAASSARVASAKRPPDPEVQLGFMNRELPSLAPMKPLGMTQIQVMQMIPTPGKLGLAGRVASETAAAARYRATDAFWETRARAAMAFYDLYVIGHQIDIARETKQLVADIAKTSQTMYAVGEAKQADVLRSQVGVARMTEEIQRMESMRTAMLGRLTGILDQPQDSITGSPILPDLPDSLPPLATLIEEAERRRPMLQAGERDVAAATAGERLARKEIWPDLQLGVQYGWRGAEMGTERMGSLMIGAAIPIYARSRQLAMREEAAAMRLMSAADLAAMRAETRGRMIELYADYTKARNLGALYTTTIIPQAEGAVTASFSAYRVGSVDFMTLLDNQMSVNEYRQQLIAFAAEQGKAIAEMEMMLGRELFNPTLTSRPAR